MVLFVVHEEDGSDTLYEVDPIHTTILEQLHERRFSFGLAFKTFTTNPDGTHNYALKDLIPGPFYSGTGELPPEEVRAFIYKFRNGKSRDTWRDVAKKIMTVEYEQAICLGSDYICYLHH